ncbi:MAG: hypothetical protein J6568_07885 [Snodgrassella sp.]|nr:hypothetical protein [Snodgrassella sp.]
MSPLGEMAVGMHSNFTTITAIIIVDIEDVEILLSLLWLTIGCWYTMAPVLDSVGKLDAATIFYVPL